MPEALACLLILVVSVAVYIAAKFAALNSANSNVRDDITRLHQQRRWLEERLELAWRENWDQQMRGHIADQIDENAAALAKATAELKRAA
ncbi:MAG TPA: hypothetical protein VHE13_15000 [Opitutus sp.]|nr:hypothetical protein [Opitutus sp.]